MVAEGTRVRATHVSGKKFPPVSYGVFAVGRLLLRRCGRSIGGMKTIARSLVWLVVAGGLTELRADWGQLQAGLTEKAARAAVGAPLIASRSKSRVQATWTYDAGGYVQFERGRVTHWTAPRGAAATSAAEPTGPAAAWVTPDESRGPGRPAGRPAGITRWVRVP